MKVIEYIFESNIFNLCLGAILTVLGSMVISRNTNRNVYTEKIAEKKISAYENIFSTVRKLNQFLGIKESFPENCKIKNCQNYKLYESIPVIFFSQKSLNSFLAELMEVHSSNRIWFSSDLEVEISFLGDYLSNCWSIANKMDDASLHLLGSVLANEIEEVYINIENIIKKELTEKKIRESILSNYNRDLENRRQRSKSTFLYNNFIRSDSNKWFGTFDICNDCLDKDLKCPVKDMMI